MGVNVLCRVRCVDIACHFHPRDVWFATRTKSSERVYDEYVCACRCRGQRTTKLRWRVKVV